MSADSEQPTAVVENRTTANPPKTVEDIKKELFEVQALWQAHSDRASQLMWEIKSLQDQLCAAVQPGYPGPKIG